MQCCYFLLEEIWCVQETCIFNFVQRNMAERLQKQEFIKEESESEEEVFMEIHLPQYPTAANEESGLPMYVLYLLV